VKRQRLYTDLAPHNPVWSVGRFETSPGTGQGSVESHDDALVTDSGSVRVHALGVIKLVECSVVEQRTLRFEVVQEPLIDNVARAVDVLGIRLY
jgi:hypothetical protein